MASTPQKGLGGVAEAKDPTPISPFSPIPVANVAHTTFPEPLIWHDLCVPPTELRPEASIATGQCFNWRPVRFSRNLRSSSDEASSNLSSLSWVGVLGQRVVAVRETPMTTEFSCLVDGGCLEEELDPGVGVQRTEELREELLDYFQIGVPLEPLVAQWCESDERMATIAPCLPGLRVLRQDPVECLISFICSSNNNISRISLILNRLREKYGIHLMTLQPAKKSIADDDLRGSPVLKSPRKSLTHTTVKAAGEQAFFTFPTLMSLACASEDDLRGVGLGYRARFVRETAAKLLAKGRQLQERSSAPQEGPSLSSAAPWSEDFTSIEPSGEAAHSSIANKELGTESSELDKLEAKGRAWLESLRDHTQFSRQEVQKHLLEFTGVGQKVADCAALFSLDRSDIIPVDTHVWRIACRDLDPKLTESKSLTPLVYERVGDLFRDKYGASHAGWAHSLLFAAELPNFNTLLPETLRSEMAAFKDEERRRNAEKKAEASARKAAKSEGTEVKKDIKAELTFDDEEEPRALPSTTKIPLSKRRKK